MSSAGWSSDTETGSGRPLAAPPADDRFPTSRNLQNHVDDGHVLDSIFRQRLGILIQWLVCEDQPQRLLPCGVRQPLRDLPLQLLHRHALHLLLGVAQVDQELLVPQPVDHHLEDLPHPSARAVRRSFCAAWSGLERFHFRQEVRRLAVLTVAEMQYFEEKIARLAATEYCEYKSCPGCKTYVEREDLTNLSVQCTVCTADKKVVYQFCWQCMKPWKGKAPSADNCANDGCTNHDLKLLKVCKLTALPEVLGITDCPSIRACPTCGHRVEHDRSGCKNIICPRCQFEFCFVCLKLTPECLKTSTHFQACSDGVAPRQTSIPVWYRN